jgi:lysozyme family protein
MSNESETVEGILRREGFDYVNHPADRGGPTKFGVTQDALRRWRRRFNAQAIVNSADVAALTIDEARQLYVTEYITGPGFDRIKHPVIREFVIDSGVQHGQKAAVKFLQQCIGGLTIDGVFGPKTENVVNTVADGSPAAFYADLIAVRLEYYGAIVAHDPKLATVKEFGIRLQAENALGWARRMGEFVRKSRML